MKEKNLILLLVLALTAPLQSDSLTASRIQPLNLEWNEPAEPWLWNTFWTLQVLDVYSTHRGLKYKCVEELNPVIGRSPRTEHLILFKVSLAKNLKELQQQELLTNKQLVVFNTVGTAVVVNNVNVWNKARKVCGKR